MSITFVGQATGVTTATLPTHQANDLILAFAYNDASTTVPTVPSPFTAVTAGTGSGGGATANASVVASFYATGSGTSSGTWTNATSVVFLVYRGAKSAGAIAGTSNTNSSSVVYPTLTLQVTNGSSWVAGFAGHQSTNTTLETAPTGMTNRATVADATDEAAGHDTNGAVSSWSQQTVSVGGTTASWRSWTVEILDGDEVAPTVSTFSPANAATNIATSGNIVLTFSEAIQRGTGTITIRSGSAAGTILESIDAATSGRLSISGSVLTIDPTSLLPTSTQIFVVIPSGAIKDVTGFPAPNNYAGTSTYSFTTEAAPTLSTASPASGATGVLTGTNIALTFDKNAARGTGTITLRSGSAAGTILESFDAASSGRISISGATVTVDPTALLPTSTQVFLVVPSGAITDTSGNAYAGTSTYSFTTEAAPVANTFTPASGASGVATATNIDIAFSKIIARGTGTITLRSGSAGGTILESYDAASSNRLTLSGSTLTVDPTSVLPVLTQVFLVVPSGAITDTSGNAYAGTSTYSFTTADDIAPAVSTFSPVSGATGVSTNTNVVVTFNENIQRGTGTITIRSGSAAGTILESLDAATSDRITVSGSTLTIDPTAQLPILTAIFVVIPAGAIKDTANNNYAGTSSYSFTTADDVSPLAQTFSPADEATNVLTNANVVVTFNENIQRGTGTITLRSGSAAGTILESFDAAASGRISISGSTLTIDPTNLLPVSTVVYAVIPSGAIRDLAGNNYAGTSTYNFETEAGPTVSTFSPLSGATNITTNSNVVLTFSEAVSRGTGTITIRSGSAAGTILESLDAASSNRITVSGSTVTIDPTALLPVSTQVFVVFPSGTFTDSTGNLYTGTSGYSFTTEAAPTVSTFSPTVGATGVALDANLVLTFSKAVARGTGTLTLRKADNTTVETFDAASSNRITVSGSTYTVDPTAQFDQQTAYYLDIPAGAITDTSGNAYAGTTSYTWTSVLLGVQFPASPSQGNTYAFSGRKWRFDGTGWERPLVSKLGDDVEGPLLATTTDHWKVPVGTTAQRTGAPSAGMVRYNSTLGKLEVYSGSAWELRADYLNGITATGLSNNMGEGHSTRTSFDATTPSYDFGWRFVQGSTNGPGTGGSQFYSAYIGLGAEYPATGAGSYGMYLAIDRNTTNPYLSVRFNEANSLGSWRKINAGYADATGSVSVGTTAQRPASPTQGMIRFNTSRGCFEGYNGSAWVNMSPLNIDDVGATA